MTTVMSFAMVINSFSQPTKTKTLAEEMLGPWVIEKGFNIIEFLPNGIEKANSDKGYAAGFTPGTCITYKYSLDRDRVTERLVRWDCDGPVGIKDFEFTYRINIIGNKLTILYDGGGTCIYYKCTNCK